MLTETRELRTTLVVPRWWSVCLATSAGAGLLGSLLMNTAEYGLSSLGSGMLRALSWLAVLILAIVAARLSLVKGTPLAFAAAVIAAVTAGPAMVAAIRNFTGTLNGDWIPLGDFDDPSAEYARTIALVGLGLVILAGLATLLLLIALLLRLGAIPPADIPRTPFRLEVIGSIVVFALAAMVQVRFTTELAGDDEFIGWITWFIPVVLLLALTLRRPGATSLWTVGGLIFIFIVDPVVRSVFSLDGVGNGVYGLGLLAVPVLLLSVIVLWWNATPPPVRRRADGLDIEAPLEPWAGAALVLSFIPILAIPAVVLGHMAYERVESGSQYRGRLVAAAAILISFINVAVVVLLAVSVQGTANSLLGGL